MRRYLAGFALLGLIGCFLPVIGGTSISLFDLHHLTWRAWLIAAAFAAPAVAAWRRSAAMLIVSAISFGYLGLRLGPRCADLVLYAGIGGKLIGIAIVGGVIATVGVILERGRMTA
ncbi:MAG: hypothetical protein E6J90_31620 [Deltaproteobacteria bacterium]|nr:MAG: hypothetical protein E6J91_49995 [Deltaproteobacteria bacterium]TMQ12400.1 MAG: hypothetical protein E6J90_31620 [Deltaproteobacteria bacterium]